jgi:endonuclease YncB( thermonuclease family)
MLREKFFRKGGRAMSTHLVRFWLAALILICVVTGCNKEQVPPPQPTVLDRDRIKVLDGDSFMYDGDEYRLLGADAPETDSPHLSGNQEPYGTQAKNYLADRIRKATRLEIVTDSEKDKYRRKLAYLIADGENLSAALVKVGLAYESISFYGFGNERMRPYAQSVMAAAASGVKPQFEAPYLWRKAHRKGVGQ